MFGTKANRLTLQNKSLKGIADVIANPKCKLLNTTELILKFNICLYTPIISYPIISPLIEGKDDYRIFFKRLMKSQPMKI